MKFIKKEMSISLKNISSPADLKKLSFEELESLAPEIRKFLIEKLSAHGGHVGPNLGVVEATIALHYVFDAPKDKLVFDVSHQSYIHKMLTGRAEAFMSPDHYDDVSGYTSPTESPEYDLFEVGHTSTSISLATGLAKARDLVGGAENVVAFIGDASMGGGMALEALNYAPELNSNFIVILNDNQRSIAENHGMLYKHLAELRATNGESPNNIFKALGYQYIYVAEGNDIRSLITAFREAKNQGHAVLVHINTMKGEGLPVAEVRKEDFHWSVPFDTKTGAPLHPYEGEDYSDIFSRHMLQRMAENKRISVITAGTPGALGFSEEDRNAAGKQFIDVGIAEQDAVAMVAGLAKGDTRPVMGGASTFVQRAYDQFEHDIAINNLPATFVLFYGSIYGINDITHLGLFDIPMLSHIPQIKFLAPASAEEYIAMIDQAIDKKSGPVIIKTPGKVWHTDVNINPDFDQYQVYRDGKEVAIISAGTFLPTALQAAEILCAKGIEVKVINPRNLSALDREVLDGLKNFRKIVTMEDGIADGGFGQRVASYLGESPVKVTVLGYKKEFIDRYNPAEILKANNMTAEQVAAILEA